MFSFSLIADGKIKKYLTPPRQSPQCASLCETISAVCIPPWRQSLQCESLHGDNLRSVNPFMETISAVWIPPRRQSPQCAWRQSPQCESLHGDNLRSVNPFMETISAVWIPPRRQSPQCASHRKDKLHSAWVKIEIFAWLWSLLKGQSGEKSYLNHKLSCFWTALSLAKCCLGKHCEWQRRVKADNCTGQRWISGIALSHNIFSLRAVFFIYDFLANNVVYNNIQYTFIRAKKKTNQALSRKLNIADVSAN